MIKNKEEIMIVVKRLPFKHSEMDSAVSIGKVYVVYNYLEGEHDIKTLFKNSTTTTSNGGSDG